MFCRVVRHETCLVGREPRNEQNSALCYGVSSEVEKNTVQTLATGKLVAMGFATNRKVEGSIADEVIFKFT
jgi:hypothetical protein